MYQLDTNTRDFPVNLGSTRLGKRDAMQFESVARTHVGCRRKTNEDAMLVRPGLWAVADGMGGHDAGEVASALVVAKLSAIPANQVLAASTAAVHSALEEANRQLWAMAGGADTPRTMGTTIVALSADDKGFDCLWAGDSRAYRVHDGVLAQLTRDHSLVQHLVDAGDLDPQAAVHHPNANIITRAVGAAPQVVIDQVSGEILPGDVFLLASDGLTRLISDDEILRALLATDLEAMADQLVKDCLARKAPDNLTFIIFRAF
jgi:serine/threonine protein phosphatase PrpC